MGENLSGKVYAKVRVSLMRNGGFPSRISYIWSAKESKMGDAEKAVMRLFLDGLHNLCNACRHASRELRIASSTAATCPNRGGDGVCKETSYPCGMKCRRVADAINEYRMEVYANAEKSK